MVKNRWNEAIKQERSRTDRVIEIITDEQAASKKLEEFWNLNISVVTNKSVLAVGGGMGYIHAFNNASRRVSVDPLYDDYSVRPSDTSVSLIKAAGEHLPVPDNTFGFFFCLPCS